MGTFIPIYQVRTVLIVAAKSLRANLWTEGYERKHDHREHPRIAVIHAVMDDERTDGSGYCK